MHGNPFVELDKYTFHPEPPHPKILPAEELRTPVYLKTTIPCLLEWHKHYVKKSLSLPCPVRSGFLSSAFGCSRGVLADGDVDSRSSILLPSQLMGAGRHVTSVRPLGEKGALFWPIGVGFIMLLANRSCLPLWG